MLFFTFGAIMWLSGCGYLIKPPVDDESARIVIERLQQNNRALVQYKGLARVHMRMSGKSQSARIAFAAIQPDKMRVELLNMIGTPLTSLSGDGETVTIISHGDRKHYRFRQTRTVLAKLIEIPIGIEDLQRLLAGRVPLPPHTSAQSATDHMNVAERDFILKNRWGGIVARLHTDQTTQYIKSLRVMDPEGAFQYQIVWNNWREVGGFRIPSQLTIESGTNQKLTLTMDRFWPNAKVAPSTFVLEPKGNHRS